MEADSAGKSAIEMRVNISQVWGRPALWAAWMVCCTTMDQRPIGLFDSGIGGLSVVRALQSSAPAESLLYFADTAYFPYGPRPAAEVRKRSFAIVARLLQSDVKMVVVACNTASAAALADLREAFPVPFVGMVPGVKPATALSRSGRVTILATEGTLDGELYSRVVTEFGSNVRVSSVVGEGLADLVERGLAGTEEARRRLAEVLETEIAAGSDTVVLGCTHYHFLSDDITALYPGVRVIDTSEAVARRALQVLAESEQLAPQDSRGGLSLIVSGDRRGFLDAMARVGFGQLEEEAV
jgi:glutamate racemase